MDIAILTVLNKISELGSFASREYYRVKDVDRQVSNLRSKLEFLMAWIQVAEEGNGIKRDQLVSVWVSQLRAAVFDAEDIVDEYIQEVYQPAGDQPLVSETKARRRGSCVPSCFPFRSVEEATVRHGLSRQIDKVLGRLDEIQRNSLFNMQPRVNALANSIQPSDRPTADTLKCGDPWILIGLDGYTQSIISLLHEDSGKREAGVVVTGESGIGKTTAARAVLQARDVQKCFDVCAWVCLPPKCRVDRYLDLIWEQAQEQTHCENCRREDAEPVLDKMKLLVVLDGMDDMDELVNVLSELPRGAKGSRIMVTTQLQSKKIQQHIPGIKSVEIKCLTRADCLQLLYRGLSGHPRRVYDTHKDKFSDQIYDISGGLPLAVVLLRGLVYFKDHETQWDEVFKLLKSYQHKRLIKRILTVSYATMPTVLKLCFLYFAAMPPNVYVDLDKLQRLWCAEGILKSTFRDMGMEGEGCVDVLVSRGLVRRVEGGTKLCIHHSVQGFAKTMAHETGFMEAHSQFDTRDTSTVRGLSVHNYADKHVCMDNLFPKIRTLLGDFAEDCDEAAHPSGSQASSSKGLKSQTRLEFLYQSKFLRVLHMDGIQIGKLPENIGRMVHLRYIGLRSCGLKDLPSAVAKLLNLETLDITDNDVQTIVDEFWKIEKLKHVLAEKLSLPVSAASMGLVSNLETLHGVTLSSVGTQENCPLNKMWKLLSLAVVGVTAANARMLAKALEEIPGLRHLKVVGDTSPLAFPYTRLFSLELDGKILFDEAAAQALNSSCSLTKCRLVLRSSCMSQVLLDSFLSNLLLGELALLDDSFIGLKLLLRGGPFCDIEEIRIGNLKQLEELVLESEMPLLKTIEIFGCPNMKTIQGLKNTDDLRNVVLFDMPEIVAQLQGEDKELSYKIKHVRTAAWEVKT